MPNIIDRLKNAQAEKDTAKIINTLLPELFQAEKDGLIKVLPCKVGTEIYCIGANGKIQERYFSLTYNRPSDFGKTVFLTHEAAEKALKESENQ